MSEERAKQYINKAHDELKGNTFLNWLGLQTVDKHAVAELLVKGAEQYRMMFDWENAAKYFLEAVEIYLTSDSALTFFPVTNTAHAAECYLKINNFAKACDCYDSVINILIDDSRFADVAKYIKRLAEIYESQNDIDNALRQYKKASDYYLANGTTYEYLKCLEKNADLLIIGEKYDEAGQMYFLVADTYRKNHPLKHKYHSFLLDAYICCLSNGDWISCDKKLETYLLDDMDFILSSEYKIIDWFLKCFKNYEIDKFQEKLQRWTLDKKLKKWHVTVLTKLGEGLDEDDLC